MGCNRRVVLLDILFNQFQELSRQVVATKRVRTTWVTGTTALVTAHRLMPAITGVLHQPRHTENRYHNKGRDCQESDRFLTHIHKPTLLLDLYQQTLSRIIGTGQLLLYA